MDEMTINYVRTNKIDTFQKLRFVLFLHKNPHIRGTSHDFAKQLYLGDTCLVEQIMADLESVGIIQRVGNDCTLLDKPEVRTALQHLDQAFNNPLARLKLLERVKYG